MVAARRGKLSGLLGVCQGASVCGDGADKAAGAQVGMELGKLMGGNALGQFWLGGCWSCC